MSAGEPVPSWAPYFLSVTPHAILPLQKTRSQDEDLHLINMQVRHDDGWGGLSLSQLSLCCAVSPFDILAGALDFANIEGQDSALVPLTQDVLYALVADLEMMSEYIQNNFALRESGKPLSKLDATMFALRAIHVLDSGAFLLQPHTLARRSVRGQAGTAVWTWLHSLTPQAWFYCAYHAAACTNVL